jgi:hypothetical protein
MKSTVLLVILAMSLVGAWGSVGTAGQISYSMRGAEKGFTAQPNPDPPSSAVMAWAAIRPGSTRMASWGSFSTIP